MMNLIDRIIYELEDIARNNRGLLALVTVYGMVMFMAGFAAGYLWRDRRG